MQLNRKQCLTLLAALLAVAVLSWLPLRGGFIYGDDASFHLLRMQGLVHALKGGSGWPVRVYPFLNGGYGYADGLFYPDLFLLPFALLQCAGLNMVSAFNCYLVVWSVAASLSAYWAVRGMGGSHRAGLLALLLYTFCQYHLVDLYSRTACGEIQAMALLPLVLWGIYNLVKENFSRPWVLGSGFLGLLFSHTLTLMLCCLLALAFVLVYHRQVFCRAVFPRLCATAAICVLLGCYYWLPMLEQFGADIFGVNDSWGDLQTYTVTFGELNDPRFPYSIGLLMAATLILCALLFCCHALGHGWKATARLCGTAGVALLLGALGLLLPVRGLLPWAALNRTFLHILQFPWRFNIFSHCFIALSAAFVLDRFCQKRTRLYAALALLLTLCAVGNLYLLQQSLRPNRIYFDDVYYDMAVNRDNTYDISGKEWLPQRVNEDAMRYWYNYEEYVTPAGTSLGHYSENGDFTFSADSAGRYILPKIWYKGYTAALTPADGTAVVLLPVSPSADGFVQLDLPEGLTGSVTVAYTGTRLQALSNVVSLLTLLGFAGWWMARRGKVLLRVGKAA